MSDPIFRSMEKDGQRYLYGSVKFNSAISRRLVEQNLDRLKRYPAVHYMRTPRPVGQIDFNSEIYGKRTYLGDDAFHLLIKVYDECEEWPILREGSWGFELEARGDIVYAVTVVDSPLEVENVAYAIQRSFAELRTRLAGESCITFGLDSLFTDAQLECRSASAPNLSEHWQDLDYPEICSPTCEHRQCGFYRPQNFGRACFHRLSAIKENH